MMAQALSPRDRRALLLGVSIIGVIMVAGRVVPAWRRWQATAVDAAHATTLSLAHSRAEIIEQRVVDDSLVARKARLTALRASWLEGDTPAAAAAALAGEISGAGGRAGVTIGALDIRLDSSANLFMPVRVHATAVGDIDGVAKLLAAIEGDRVALSIRALSIDAADPAAPPNQPEVLRTELTVEATWRRAAPGVRP